MLAVIRRFAKTWPARALFVVLVGAFGLWGIAGRLANHGGDTTVAKVGDQQVGVADAQRAFTRQLQQLSQQNGPSFQPAPSERQRIAMESTQQLVLQDLVANELHHLGIVVTDAAIRDTTFNLPAFKGVNGQFDRQTFLAALARNGLDESSFIDLVRQDLGRQELTGAVSAGVAAPSILLDQIFAYSRETRTVAAVDVPLATAADAPAPSDAQLRRFWANNPSLYATPEYRRVKLIVLSADTLAGQMKVSDDDIKRYYDLARSIYHTPELRSLEIVAAPDQATAARIATAWQAGLDWTAVQALSKTAGASTLELPDTKRAAVPDAALAAAAFSATPMTVSAPIKGAFNWYVMAVAKVTPAKDITLDQAHAEIRQKVGVLKANDAIDDDVNKLEDALAGGGGLDALPQSLGVAAVEGTLDAQGNTPQGTPAPLPAYPALRSAILAAVFKAKAGEPPQVQQLAPDKEHAAGAYYAFTVESIAKPSQLAFTAVADRVRLDWTTQQLRHTAEARAAGLLTAVRGGATLAAAAAAKGLTVQTLPPIIRPYGQNPVPPGVPEALVVPLFGMKKGDATMVATSDGFMVAQLDTITDPAPTSDPISATQLRAELTQSMNADTTDLLVAALEQRYPVTLNQRLIAQIAQP